MALPVTVENFIRAESDRMFASLQTEAGGVNCLKHSRAPTPIDHQPVIRMNRDTLYSSAIVDISQGATVTLPDAGERYVSVMVVNQDHFINRILHEPGEHRLTVEEFDTPWVGVAARILVDPADEDDVATVHALQDKLAINANSARPFEIPDYDAASQDATRKALLELAKHLGSFDHAFGAERDVDPVRHLIATAAGWGGLPIRRRATSESNRRFPSARTSSRSGMSPWTGSGRSRSITRMASSRQTTIAYSVNNITAIPNDDGSVTVHFGGCGDGRRNCLPLMDGWFYTVRLYRPRGEVLDGSWTFPSAEPA